MSNKNVIDTVTKYVRNDLLVTFGIQDVDPVVTIENGVAYVNLYKDGKPFFKNLQHLNVIFDVGCLNEFKGEIMGIVYDTQES